MALQGLSRWAGDLALSKRTQLLNQHINISRVSIPSEEGVSHGHQMSFIDKNTGDELFIVLPPEVKDALIQAFNGGIVIPNAMPVLPPEPKKPTRRRKPSGK